LKNIWTTIDNKAVENLYQLEPNLIYGEKLHSYHHRESNTSIASGIYEEIVDDICYPRRKTSFIFNECKDIDNIKCSLQMKPLALPPRQKQRPEYIEENRYDFN